MIMVSWNDADFVLKELKDQEKIGECFNKNSGGI